MSVVVNLAEHRIRYNGSVCNLVIRIALFLVERVSLFFLLELVLLFFFFNWFVVFHLALKISEVFLFDDGSPLHLVELVEQKPIRFSALGQPFLDLVNKRFFLCFQIAHLMAKVTCLLPIILHILSKLLLL